MAIHKNIPKKLPKVTCFSLLWCFLNCSPAESWKVAIFTWSFVLVFFLHILLYFYQIWFSLSFSCYNFSWLSLPFCLQRDMSPVFSLLSSLSFCDYNPPMPLAYCFVCQKTRTYQRLLNVQNLNTRLLDVLICAIPLFQEPQGWWMNIIEFCFLLTRQIKPFI